MVVTACNRLMTAVPHFSKEHAGNEIPNFIMLAIFNYHLFTYESCFIIWLVYSAINKYVPVYLCITKNTNYILDNRIKKYLVIKFRLSRLHKR